MNQLTKTNNIFLDISKVALHLSAKNYNYLVNPMPSDGMYVMLCLEQPFGWE